MSWCKEHEGKVELKSLLDFTGCECCRVGWQPAGRLLHKLEGDLDRWDERDIDPREFHGCKLRTRPFTSFREALNYGSFGIAEYSCNFKITSMRKTLQETTIPRPQRKQCRKATRNGTDKDTECCSAKKIVGLAINLAPHTNIKIQWKQRKQRKQTDTNSIFISFCL